MNGKGYSTITSVRGVLKPAFQMACDEDVLLKNPFQFNLGDVIVNDSKHREAMTPAEQLRRIEMTEQGTTPFFTPNTTPKWRKSGVEIRRDMKTG